MRNFKDQPQGFNEVIKQRPQLLVTGWEATTLAPVFTETLRAETKHPTFVVNMADALLVIGEELGEAQQAYIDFMYAGADKELIRKELVETMATIMRTLLNFDELTTKLIPSTLDEFNDMVDRWCMSKYVEYGKNCTCVVCQSAKQSAIKNLLKTYKIIA